MCEVRHFAAFSNMLEQLCYFTIYSTFHNNFFFFDKKNYIKRDLMKT